MPRSVRAGVPPQTVSDQAQSPIERVPSRKIKPVVSILLYARSAGHCQFENCTNDITEHHVTKRPGNHGQQAHIVAFRRRGARGEYDRPEDVNSIGNLMLLCAGCHKEVDDFPLTYPRHALEAMKRRHEDFVRETMRTRPQQATHVIVLLAPIGGRPVEIADDEIREALRPRNPGTSTFSRIDLSGMTIAETDRFYAAAREVISTEVTKLHASKSYLRQTAHGSIFALAPIPLLKPIRRRRLALARPGRASAFRNREATGSTRQRCRCAPDIHQWFG